MNFKDINGIRFIDGISLFESVSKYKNEDRLNNLLVNAGVEFYDEEKRLVKKPSIGIIGVGGLSFDFSSVKNELPIRNTHVSLSTKELKRIFSPLQAIGGYMSYLNSGNLDTPSMIDVMEKYNHFSTLHTSYINIGIFGISSLVENEFNCQRDLMHLARITEARTSVQNKPPLVVLYPEYVEHHKKMLELAENVRANVVKTDDRDNKDYLESVNSLYPSSKATGIVVSVTLRNLLKIVGMLSDNGKEEEMKRVLALVNDSCHALWPKFFKETSSYGYALPTHLSK